MFSPEFTKFLIQYQMNEYKETKSEKKYIYFKRGGGIVADVKITVKK